MEPNEIAYVEPGVMLLDPEAITIPVGTMAVIPHRDYDPDSNAVEIEGDEEEVARDTGLPVYTLLCAGQSLKRELYPELAPILGGDFYTIQVPDLVGRFIIGVDATTNEIIRGDAVIYYQSVPQAEKQARDIRYA